MPADDSVDELDSYMYQTVGFCVSVSVLSLNSLLLFFFWFPILLSKMLFEDKMRIVFSYVIEMFLIVLDC